MVAPTLTPDTKPRRIRDGFWLSVGSGRREGSS
jgi:hypothetical protein